MDSVLRKLGLKRGESKDTDARKRLQKELFSFQKGVEYGFPYKPSSLGHDPSLGFLAIGTSSGALFVYGKPGVQFTGQHTSPVAVTQITFLPEQARLLTLCNDSSLHLWEMNTKSGVPTLEEIKTFKLDTSKGKNIPCFCLSSTGDEILLGTDNGTVLVVDFATFDLSAKVFALDVLLEKASEDLKANPGQVQVILQKPLEPSKFLIGFSSGILVLFDAVASTVEHTYNVSQPLESATFHENGDEFVTSHADGSYAIWKTEEGKPKESSTPYGPFPCKAITKIASQSSNGSSYLVFSGGMPRASYGEKNTVSVIRGEKHVVFDLTSKVVDFLTVFTDSSADSGEVRSLIILAEEELVSIDLSSDAWQVQQLPYLANVHSSPVTCMTHVDQVPDAFWSKFTAITGTSSASYSSKVFPVDGGKVTVPDALHKELLITGHEDGSVLFWDVSVPKFHLLYKLKTADFFEADDHPSQAADTSEDTWPPFQKVGSYDLYSDSPRLKIEKISFCMPSETLVVAGASGQVMVLKFSAESSTAEQKSNPVSVSDQTSAWSGPDALTLRSQFNLAPGFQPVSFVQMNPPAPCTALAVNSEWQLFAVGSVLGFLVYDYLSNKTVYAKGTQVPHGGKHGVSRSKSFQMTFRESIRHLRKRGSSVETKEHKPKADAKPDGASKSEDEKKEAKAADEAAPSAESKDDAAKESQEPAAATDKPAEETGGAEEAKPEEKKSDDAVADAGAAPPTDAEKSETIESKESETGAKTATLESEGEGHSAAPDGAGEKSHDHSVSFAPSTPTRHSEQSGDATVGSPLCAIRSLSFAQTFITNAQAHAPTLWVGTSGGQVLIYQLGIPVAEKRSEDDIQITLVKEIHLRHRAPIVGIFVVDRDGRPVSSDLTGGHRVLVCSQEQLKLFSLPSLKACNKYKVALHHNEAKISQVAFANFKSKSDEEYKEKDLVCLTNHGDVIVFSVPHLRPQLKAELSTKEGRLGDGSFALTDNGFGFYQPNPSQLEKFGLSAAGHAQLLCALELKEGMRPVEIVVEEPAPAKEEEKTDEAEKEEKTEESTKPEQPEEKKETVEEVAADPVKTVDEKQTDENIKVIPVIVGGSGDGGLNDSVAPGDITSDSIKVHFTEDGAEMSMVVTCHDVIENRMVVKTTERTISDADGVRTEKKTVVEEKSSRVESSIQEGVPTVTVGGD